MKSIPASHESDCTVCRERINEGEAIVVLSDYGEWVHVDCAELEGYEVDE